jgi:signal transduction histidine kinase
MKTWRLTKNKIPAKAWFSLLAGVLILQGSYESNAQDRKYKYHETTNLVSLVDDAAALVSKKGMQSFNDLMTDGTRWRTGDTYLFVTSLKGDIYVHENKSLIGKNLYDLKDVHGKSIIQWFIKKALSQQECGWTHYEWVRPGDSIPSWKTTYVKLAKAPSGTFYVIGSGLYDMRMEKEFAIEAVNDATSLIRTWGKDAFPALRDSSSEFIYKDTYVFVIDTLCNTLVNPGAPWLEGKNQKNMQDAAGKYLFQEMVRVTLDIGQGWVDYLWPKPGTTKPVQKFTFVKRVIVGDEVYIAGTGVYLD